MQNQPSHSVHSRTTRRPLSCRALLRAKVVSLLALLMLLALLYPQLSSAAPPIGLRLNLTETALPPTPTSPPLPTATPVPPPTATPVPPPTATFYAPAPEPPRGGPVTNRPPKDSGSPESTPTLPAQLSPTADLTATAAAATTLVDLTATAAAATTPAATGSQAPLPKIRVSNPRPGGGSLPRTGTPNSYTAPWFLALGGVALVLAGALLARRAMHRRINIE